MDSISVILLKYFKVLYFTNLACTTKFLKYKYGNFAHWSNMKVVSEKKKISVSQVKWRKGLFTVGALKQHQSQSFHYYCSGII